MYIVCSDLRTYGPIPTNSSVAPVISRLQKIVKTASKHHNPSLIILCVDEISVFVSSTLCLIKRYPSPPDSAKKSKNLSIF